MGANVKASGGDEDMVVKKASVGGCMSEGMLCDPPMLGWVGGGAGNAALVPVDFAPGDTPPESRPRMDQPKAAAEPAMPAVDVKPLFEKKLTKEEKKAAAAVKKAEREAKKAAAAASGAADPEGEDAAAVAEGVDAMTVT